MRWLQLNTAWKSIGIRCALLLSFSVVTAGCATSAHGSSVDRPPGNGTLLSHAKVPNYPLSGATLYRLYYESHGQRIEAYLTIPDGPGRYPLVVNLHGGAAWRTIVTHDNFGYTARDAASLASSQYAVLYPEYQGYMASSGDMDGLFTDARNTVDGIHAAESLAHVDPHRVFLVGYSIGGGVALKVAGMLSGVRAVVAVSPYVGLRIVLPWQQAQAKPGTIFWRQLGAEVSSYGAHPSIKTLSEESPDLAAIRAPVLLLQGTDDHHVAYQTVQQFYREMKAAGKVVKLILYPGGHHGLHGINQAASHQAARAWFASYGLALNP